jgi:hypothetical protein
MQRTVSASMVSRQVVLSLHDGQVGACASRQDAEAHCGALADHLAAQSALVTTEAL